MIHGFFNGYNMKTIKETVTNTIIIEKSKFITYLIPISNKQELENHLFHLKNQYADATHLCYAAIYEENGMPCYKSSDDGEPVNTAKAPILNALQKQSLSHILCAVIRYFGGIKLGAGGLCRAYGKSCLEAIKLATIVEAHLCDVFQFHIGYENERLITYTLNHLDGLILSKKYELDVIYEVAFKTESAFQQFKSNFKDLQFIKIKTMMVTEK